MDKKYQFDESDLKLFQDRVAVKREQKFDSIWAIKVNGEMYVTSSGKCGWKQIGHAKSALKADCWSIAKQIEKRKVCKTPSDYRLVWSEYLQFLIDSNIVEFVEIC